MTKELEAYDAVMAGGGNHAQALGAAAAVTGRDLVEMFNEMLSEGSLAFEFTPDDRMVLVRK